MIELTLDDFKEDIICLIIRYNNKNLIDKHVDKLIGDKYSHIKTDCLDYFNSESRASTH